MEGRMESEDGHHPGSMVQPRLKQRWGQVQASQCVLEQNWMLLYVLDVPSYQHSRGSSLFLSKNHPETNEGGRKQSGGGSEKRRWAGVFFCGIRTGLVPQLRTMKGHTGGYRLIYWCQREITLSFKPAYGPKLRKD